MAHSQVTCIGFFGLCASTAMLAATLTRSAVVNCSGLQRGTHIRWRLVAHDRTSAQTTT